MKGQIIFVSGIHGVGKTTLCNTISEQIGINSYSSSNLIREFKELSSNKKTVDNVNKNQDILLESIRLNIEEEREYILDGHFILIDENYELKELPLSTFRDMNIKAIIILYEDVDIILERLSSRDEVSYTKDFIEDFQRKEIERGIEVAKILDKPYKVLKSTNYKEILKEIENIIR
ncbi:MAG: ATP-binding protein [Tissierellaceae bacterium]